MNVDDFKIGDKVTLSVDSEFYDPDGGDEFNPFGVTGTVSEVVPYTEQCSCLNIIVDWGFYSKTPYQRPVTNSYNPEDLEIV